MSADFRLRSDTEETMNHRHSEEELESGSEERTPSPTSPGSPTSPQVDDSSLSSPVASSSSSQRSFSSPRSSHSTIDQPELPIRQTHKIATALPPRPSIYSRHSSPSITSVPSRARVRGLGLTPLSTSPENTSHPLNSGLLPKSQPLSRALFAKMANDVPHAGMGGGKKKGGQKLIVPTKSFRTTFELGLTASELARR